MRGYEKQSVASTHSRRHGFYNFIGDMIEIVNNKPSTFLFKGGREIRF